MIWKYRKELLIILNNIHEGIVWKIAGIPDTEGKGTNNLVVKVGQLAGIKIERKDISASHRLSKHKSTYSTVTNQRHTNPINSIARIIVKFT